MRFRFFDRRSAERFAELLDDSDGAPRHHGRGRADSELAELVAIGHNLSAARSRAVHVDPEFRVGLRAMLVATAERDGIGRYATAPEEDAGPVESAPSAAGVHRLFGNRIRARGAIVVGVATGALAVSGISAASESAEPGDALYSVKRSTERAQLAMAGSDLTRGQLSLNFARTRLAEAAAMSGDDPGFAGVLDDMDVHTRDGVRMLTSAATTGRDATPLTPVDSFVATQRRTLAPLLDRLGPANRERATRSAELLGDVARRTDLLRAGLACEPVTPDGADALGPILSDCRTDADAGTAETGTTPRRPGSSARPGDAADPADPTAPDAPQRTAPAGGGTGTAPDRAADRAADEAPADNAPGAVPPTPAPTVSTSPTTKPADGGPADPGNGDQDNGDQGGGDEGGGLGDLLGDLLGGN